MWRRYEGGASERAVALVERLFALLHECRALVPQREAAGPDPESVSAQAERLLYYALVGALEVGLVRTVEDALTVLRQASQPLGPTTVDGVPSSNTFDHLCVQYEPSIGPNSGVIFNNVTSGANVITNSRIDLTGAGAATYALQVTNSSGNSIIDVYYPTTASFNTDPANAASMFTSLTTQTFIAPLC